MAANRDSLHAPAPEAGSVFERRAAEKARSRAADEQALASGEKSREQLRRENGHFASIAHAPIDWSKVRRLA